MEERRSRTILLRVFQHFLTILTLSTTPSAWPINLGQVILNTYPTSTTPSLILGSPSGESARRTGAASGLQVMFPITHSFSDKRDQYLVIKVDRSKIRLLIITHVTTFEFRLRAFVIS